MFSKQLFNVYLEEQQCTRGKNKHTNKQTQVFSFQLCCCPEQWSSVPNLWAPKVIKMIQRLDRNGKRLARAFSREDRAIGPLRVFKLMSHLSYQISFLSIYKRRALDGIVINTLIPGHPLPRDLWLLLPGSPAC